MKHRVYTMLHKHRPYCNVEYGANKSWGGRVQWQSCQCGTHLCYLWMYAVGTLNAFVWVISLNYASITMYDVTVRDAASAIQEEKAYTWAKKLLFFFFHVRMARTNGIEGHYQMCTKWNMCLRLQQTMHQKKCCFICYSKEARWKRLTLSVVVEMN